MEAYSLNDRKAAAKKACALKKNKEVRDYIDNALKEAGKMAKIDAKKVMELLSNIAFTSPASFVKIKTEDGKQKIVWKDISHLPSEVKNAIATVKNTPGGIVVETLDRMKAIDLLMKYMGITSSGEGGVVFSGEDEIK